MALMSKNDIAFGAKSNTERSFSSWLKERRKALGLSRKELAERVGCSEVTIVKLEMEERRPSRQIAELLAQCLELEEAERAAFVELARYPPGQQGKEQAARRETVPNNLPAPPTSFVGRESAVASVRDLFRKPGVRLVTLTGAPGIGKTRLGLQVAEALLDSFKDGVFFVALAPIRDLDRVPAAIAQALNVRENPGEPLQVTLQRYLRERRLLLLIDNFEQVTAAAPLLGTLLLSSPGLKLLVTSREVLHIYGEHDFPVPPLEVPGSKFEVQNELGLPGTLNFEPGTLERYETVRLFVERAVAVEHAFSLTSENAQAVVEICRRLDGLPLAIELAAAQVRTFAPQEMLPRLQSALDLLVGGPLDLPPRQQALRSAISWSYDLLDESEAALFRRLAVFVGGATLEAVEAVCAGDGRQTIDDGRRTTDDGRRGTAQDMMSSVLASLVDKSLLNRERVGVDNDSSRYTLLETVREYAWEKLAESDEVEPLRKRHAAFYLELVEKAGPQLTGEEHEAWYKRLQLEYDNIRAALATSIEYADAETALRFGTVLWRFWDMHGYISEGRRWLDLTLQLDSSAFPLLRSNVLSSAGILAWTGWDLDTARSLHKQSLALRRQLGDKQRTASSLNNLALVVHQQGEYREAFDLLAESLEICRELDDKADIASTLNNLGNAAHAMGDADNAYALLEEGLELWREVGDMYGVALVLNDLAEVERSRGNYERAVPLYIEGIEKMREMDDNSRVANALHNMAHVLHHQGDLDKAYDLFAESLTIRRDLDDRLGIYMSLTGLAGVVSSRGLPEKAALLFGAAESLLEDSTFKMQPIDKRDYDRNVERTRAQIGDAAWSSAWDGGRAMKLEDAILFALA
ncbi:MAG TPA: tetratricopeptide repeat protein [Chloroflexia bacterium]|nr:tetratricopeptide repeat protein [Chloroflexia bacterium]